MPYPADPSAWDVAVPLKEHTFGEMVSEALIRCLVLLLVFVHSKHKGDVQNTGRLDASELAVCFMDWPPYACSWGTAFEERK